MTNSARWAGRSLRMPRIRDEVIDVLVAKSRDDDSGCIIWTGTKINSGYGRMTWKVNDDTVLRGAHRVAYWALVDAIPDGLVVDHLCRTRACINVDHLDLVKQRENVMRSPIARGALNYAKKSCPKGHPYSPDNTYIWSPKNHSTVKRICRACRSEYFRRYQANRKAVA